MLVLKKETFTQKENIIMTACFVALTWGVSVVFPTIDKVIGIMGGLCAATLDYAIPVYCWVKLSDKPWYSCYNLSAILFFGTLTLIGYVSVGIIVYEIVADKDTMPRWK